MGSRQDKSFGVSTLEGDGTAAMPPCNPAKPMGMDPVSGPLGQQIHDVLCVCSEVTNPGAPSWFTGNIVRSRQGWTQVRDGFSYLLILPFKSTLSREKAELQKTLIYAFQDVGLLKGLVNLAFHFRYATKLVCLTPKTS